MSNRLTSKQTAVISHPDVLTLTTSVYHRTHTQKANVCRRKAFSRTVAKAKVYGHRRQSRPSMTIFLLLVGDDSPFWDWSLTPSWSVTSHKRGTRKPSSSVHTRRAPGRVFDWTPVAWCDACPPPVVAWRSHVQFYLQRRRSGRLCANADEDTR